MFREPGLPFRAGCERDDRKLVAWAQLRLHLPGPVTVPCGLVSKPFAKKPVAIEIERYLSCQQREKVPVAKVTPDRRGRFSVTIPLPDGVKSAIYRARTRVATRTGGPAKAPTFTLPRAVDL